jgi:catechol-2,3-dioxygenase
VGASDHGTTKSFYAKDPDGLEFEVCWVVPADQLTGAEQMTTMPLDLDATIERYGATTVGGR